MVDFKVNLLGVTENPQTLSVAGALGCFAEKSSAQIMTELLALSEEQRLKRERGVLRNSFGRGHGSVGDQNYFIFSIEDLPRAATFQLCLPEYLAHLQQSLRRAKASRGFHLPAIIKNSRLASKAEEILSKSFELYEKMVQDGIAEEDARYLLPLYTKTNIQTGGNARELCHLWQMSHLKGVPSVVKAVVDEMINQAKERAPYLFENFGFNYETLAWYPSAQLYALKNTLMEKLAKLKIASDVFLLSYQLPSFLREYLTAEAVEKMVKNRDEAELSNLKHVHFDFLVAMSLACLHQAIRQRTWNHSVEPIYQAVQNALATSSSKKERIVIPPAVRSSEFSSDYQKQHFAMLNLYQELLGEGIPKTEAVGVLPHSLKIYTLIHVNGWNAIHSIGKRTCLEAQWEIRFIAQQMAKIIKEKLPALGKWAEPQCVTYGKCPEFRDCGYYKRKR